MAGPVWSADGRPSQTVVRSTWAPGLERAARAVDSIGAITRSYANGLASYVAGPLGNAADTSKAASGIDSTLLYAALAVVIVILLITYRSPVLWLLPVISAGVALITAEAVIYLLAAHAGLTVNEESAGILSVLVFGASTDYALLIVARYREELRRHDRRHAAMAVALRRAGPAIIASGCHRHRRAADAGVRGAELDQGPGPGAGDRRRGRHARHADPAARIAGDLPPRGLLAVQARLRLARADHPGAVGPGRRSIAPRPRLVWIATAVVLGMLALGLTGLKASGLTNAQSFRGHPDSVTGERVLAAHFPAGAGQPVIVVGNQSAAAALRAAFAATPGIAGVTPPEAQAAMSTCRER